MFKVKNPILSLLLILFLFLSMLLPFTTSAEENKEYQLFKTLQSVELEEGMVIPEGSYLYGVEKEEAIQFQYGITHANISKDLITLEEITDESTAFSEVNTVAPISNQLPAGSALYSLTGIDETKIAINKNLEYPVHINENDEEIIYLGNVEYIVSYSENEDPVNENESIETEEEQIAEKPVDVTEQSADSVADRDFKTKDEVEKAEKSSVKQEKKLPSISEDNEDVSDTPIATASLTMTTTATKSSNPWEGVSSKYFKVTADDAVVYDNRGGPLKPVGKLKNGQIYHRVSDYGNWHRIQFGNIYGYVSKSKTIPVHNHTPKHKNTSYKNQNKYVTPKNDVVVYDNTSGKLVPIGTINKNIKYPIASDYGNWWRIIYSDMIGYVNKNEVQVDFTNSDKYFRVLEDNLPVYDNRTGSLIKVGTLEKGKDYKRVSDYGNWHRIQFGNIYGYVKKSNTAPSSGASIQNENKQYKNTSKTFTALDDLVVYDNTSGKLIPFGTIDKNVKYSVASDYGNWWRIIYSDMVGYVHKDGVKVDFSASDKYFRVLKEGLPIYDNRTGSLIQVGTLQKGKEYKRVSDYGNWHRIQFGNTYGYVLKSATEPSSGAIMKNENKQYKSKSLKFKTLQVVPVYDNSSGNLVQIGTIAKDVEYSIASDYGNWWRIIYSDTIGYVHKNHVDLTTTRIFIDPGHGAHDPGGTGFGLKEKDVVLDIATKTANFLLSNYLDVEVQLSRATDVFLSLTERAKKANDWGADYFVSLHTNAHNGSANGFETFIYNGTVSQETKDKQRDIHNYLIDRMNAYDRGMKKANFGVLRETKMSSILIEYLFIDNHADNQLLKSSSYRSTLARITAEAIAYSYGLTAK